MKPSAFGHPHSNAPSTPQPPADSSSSSSIPSDPPPAYTPNPDFSTPSASGDAKTQPGDAATPHEPSSAVASSSRTDPLVLTPTAQPVPGRPLLHDGQCLVYKDGVYCHKCGNTGYKNDDPYHPCKSCWKKYGRPYTSALAHVWGSSTTSPTPTDSDSKHPPTNQQQQQQQPLPPPQNYQRPLLLTNFHPSPAAAYTGIVMNHSYMRPGLIERGAQQNRIRPSQFQPAPAPAPAPPPPPPSLVAPEPSGTQNEKHGYGYAYGNAQQNSFAPPPLPPPASAPLQPGVVPPQQYTSMPSNGYLAQQQSGLPVLPGDAGIGGV